MKTNLLWRKKERRKQPSIETNTKSILHSMSEVSLRDKEILILKRENWNLVETIRKKEEERKFFENKNKDLLDINDKLVKN